MILESLISDGTILTLDCAKATLRQGVRVEIDDEFYFENEVQSAIKLGFVRLVGEPPLAAEPKPKDVIRKLKNVHNTRIAFECIKGSVGPGEFISIPESMIEEPEIARALGYGMLFDPSGVAKKPMTSGTPVNLDEVSVLDDDDDDAPLEKVSLSEMNISDAATSKIVKTIVEMYKIMPLTFDGEILIVAAATEETRGMCRDLKFMLNCEVRAVLADEGEILAAIEEHYSNSESLEDLEKPVGVSGVSEADLEDEPVLEDVFGGPEGADVPDDIPEDVPAARPQPKAAPKAKSISRVGEGDVEGDDDEEDNTLFAPSRTLDPEAATPKSKDKAKSSEKTDNDDDIDFMTLFGDDGG